MHHNEEPARGFKLAYSPSNSMSFALLVYGFVDRLLRERERERVRVCVGVGVCVCVFSLLGGRHQRGP